MTTEEGLCNVHDLIPGEESNRYAELFTAL